MLHEAVSTDMSYGERMPYFAAAAATALLLLPNLYMYVGRCMFVLVSDSVRLLFYQTFGQKKGIIYRN
jgi:hypothetical protein